MLRIDGVYLKNYLKNAGRFVVLKTKMGEVVPYFGMDEMAESHTLTEPLCRAEAPEREPLYLIRGERL